MDTREETIFLRINETFCARWCRSEKKRTMDERFKVVQTILKNLLVFYTEKTNFPTDFEKTIIFTETSNFID